MAMKQRLIRVAIDAMGGDYAPTDIVTGAVQAARQGNVQLILVGDIVQVQAELSKHDIRDLPVTVVPSEGLIAENEAPALAMRQKPRASIMVATRLVKEGHADACVTMGSTGAALASSVVLLGVIEGIDRPALGGPVVGLAPQTLIIDVGASVDCRPGQLLNFAVIGEVFARQFWGVERPRVALLSVGSELGKGNRQVREASQLLSGSGLNFVGNVEANDLPFNIAEVVVCDGFVGNIVMKLTEGLGKRLSEHLREVLRGKLTKSELEEVAHEVYALNSSVEILGGGPLFGVNGVSVVGHGAARAESLQRAVDTARLVVESNFIPSLNEELARKSAETSM